MRWVVLVDGHEDLLRQVYAAAKRYKVEITVVQDFIHVLDYLWKAAHALHPEAGEEREAWVKDRAHALLPRAGPRMWRWACAVPPPVSNWVRASASRWTRPPATSRTTRSDSATMRPWRKGLPIATEVIEGACRHLIKDRMDITGARWGLKRAEAILKLRSLMVSGDLEAYLAFHLKQERRRNHPRPPIPEVAREAA
jgi:hypothetical protein